MYSTALTGLTSERGSRQFWRLDFSHRFNFVSTLVGDSKSRSSVVLHALCYCRLTTASSWRKPNRKGSLWNLARCILSPNPDVLYSLSFVIERNLLSLCVFSKLPAATVPCCTLLFWQHMKSMSQEEYQTKAFESCLLSNEKYQFKLNLGSFCLLVYSCWQEAGKKYERYSLLFVHG